MGSFVGGRHLVDRCGICPSALEDAVLTCSGDVTGGIRHLPNTYNRPMRLTPMRPLRIPEPCNHAPARCVAGQPACRSDSGRRRLVVLLVCMAVVACSCARPIRSGALLDAYRAAACVVPTLAEGVDPPTRGWDSTIVMAGGSKVTIRGAELGWGEITVQYEPDGRNVVAVDPGDYIAPNDVRLNDQRDRLYVKASGAAAGIWEETWLYEYDLIEQRPLRKNRVHPEALPPECQMPKK